MRLDIRWRDQTMRRRESAFFPRSRLTKILSTGRELRSLPSAFIFLPRRGIISPTTSFARIAEFLFFCCRSTWSSRWSPHARVMSDDEKAWARKYVDSGHRLVITGEDATQLGEAANVVRFGKCPGKD